MSRKFNYEITFKHRMEFVYKDDIGYYIQEYDVDEREVVNIYVNKNTVKHWLKFSVKWFVYRIEHNKIKGFKNYEKKNGKFQLVKSRLR